MSMRTQEELVDLVSDLGNGFGLLTILAGRVSAPMTREAVLDAFGAFEAAYGPAAELQALGQLETGGGILSSEMGERITRLGSLLRAPVDDTGTAAEVRALAEECLQMLAPKAALSDEPSAPT